MRPLITTLLLLCAAPAAVAAPPMRNPDLDRDGKVTLDEFRSAGPRGGMTRLDSDKDGRISKAEFDVMARRAASFGGSEIKTRVAAMWSFSDTDKDGFITRDEQLSAQRRRFEAADSNHDGWLSKDELTMLRQIRARGG